MRLSNPKESIHSNNLCASGCFSVSFARSYLLVAATGYF